MKQVFRISVEEIASGQQALSLLLGARHCAFAVTDPKSHFLRQLAYYTISDSGEILSLIESEPLLSDKFVSVAVGFQHPGFTLLPRHLVKEGEEKNIIQIMCGADSSSKTLVEPLSEWQLHVMYPAADFLVERLQSLFPALRYTHELSLRLRSLNGRDGLFADFRHDDFSVFVIRDNHLLFAGSYGYSIAADVLYHLLKVCSCYGVFPEKTAIVISGLVDKESSVCVELLQYFHALEFRDADWATPYPAHYFTTLNDLARCA